MTTTQTNPGSWAGVCELLQCPDCGGALEAADEALRCLACQRDYPIQQGTLDMLPPLDGNNRIAADFYNGPLWPRFRFWEWLTYFFNGGVRRARNKVLRHLPNLSGTRLLDVAIGDGSNLPWIPPDCEVHGVDISVVQLAQCRDHFAGRDVHLILGEAEKLPYRDRSFDNVLSYGAFNYFNDPLKALQEMARVVKPGGLIVIGDEQPNLPNRMLGYWIGLPGLDRWVMSRIMHLGPEFTTLVDRHRHLKVEPIVREVLDEWQILPIWLNVGYCIIGKAHAQHNGKAD